MKAMFQEAMLRCCIQICDGDALSEGCWWLLRLPGEGGCWLRLARRVVAGPLEVLHVAGYICQGQQQGASVKEVGR